VRIAFLGLPLGACLLHHDGHEIVLCGLSRIDSPGVRRIQRLLGDKVLLKPRLEKHFIARLRAARPDLVVSWFWTNRIPTAVIEVAPLGGFGVHPSLLPRHRGPDPTTWALLSGDRETGVTAHRLAAEYDTGAILASESLNIDPRWNSWELARALDRPSLRVLRAVTRRFALGDPPEELQQDEAQATSAPFLSDEEAVLHWTESVEQITRLVRALAPSPGARMEIAGEELAVLEVEPLPLPSYLEQPGEMVLEQGRPRIACRDGSVRVLRAEWGGEEVSPEQFKRLFSGQSG
jgi:methionyl-tRNA formyltransferase